MQFDPDAAARPDSGLFGLSCTRDDARVIVLPVPYEATTSYRTGTAKGPDAVLEASHQVDLYDRLFGRVYEKGIHMPEAPAWIRTLSDQTRRIALPLIEKGGAEGGDAAAVQAVDAAGRRIEEHVRSETAAILREGKVPALLGGEHSISFGAIAACAAAHGPIGVLQIDAHMDLRERFEGFETSHASIMHRVITGLPQVTRLVQVGIRDFGEGEWAFAREHGADGGDGRVRVLFDDDIAERTLAGGSFKDLCNEAVGALPDRVYVSFDIDGLDPALCPHTGTPVPGGLSFQQASAVLAALKASGKQVVGFDLVEVAPGPRADEPEWDANVGARVLYRLCGVA
ncbi:MAG: agmatinase [Phycisphaerales bacterium]